MAEWSKALAWKVSIRQKRIEGSNPSRSATISLRINDVPLWEAENLQFPRRFAAGTETSETAKTAKIGL